MEQKAIFLVDGENVSAKYADMIVAVSDCLGAATGTVIERRVYHHQKDPGTRAWTEKAKGGEFKDILLCGQPAKDKVDRKMQKDARRYLNESDVAIVCVVTSDGGFCRLAEDADAAKKELYFIGGKNPSHRLRNTSARFMKLKWSKITVRHGVGPFALT